MHLISLMRQILIMSYTGSIVIIIILFVRLLLKKSPKIYSYLLWGIVLFRLLCPLSVTSSFSLFGLAERVPAGKTITELSAGPSYRNINVISEPSFFHGNPDDTARTVPDSLKSGIQMEDVIWMTATCFWLLGICFICGYGAYSFRKAKKMLHGAKQTGDHVYEIYRDAPPFVIGVFRPRICLPIGLDRQERDYILLHEKTHIRRRDYLVKLIAFLTLSIHWFNPLVWIAFYLMEKDMELSCDEAVMRHMRADIRTAYAQSLLKLSTVQRRAIGAPLAFGAGGIKERINNIIHYKKPTLSAAALAVFVIAVCCIALGSNPKDVKTSPQQEKNQELQSDTDLSDHANTGQIRQENNDSALKTETGTDQKSQLDTLKENAPSEIPQSDLSKENVSDNTERITDLTEAEETLKAWAWAFCSRDGNTIAGLSQKEVQESLIERGLLSPAGGSFHLGMSSPWMWSENDYQIVSYNEKEAVILYYAWTSDPHVTVWYETLSYHKEDDVYCVDFETLTYLDYICTGEEFLKAYPFGLTDTRMDYAANGAGESLNKNALLSSSNVYRGLFEPDTAASMLLNLLNNPNKVEILAGPAKEDGSVPVQVTFTEDGSVFIVTMIRPYQDGIWLPQSFRQYENANAVKTD